MKLKMFLMQKMDILGITKLNQILGFVGRTNIYEFEDSGVAPKFNISHRPNDNLLVYATYSEGFRPSGINRTTGRTAELVPDTYTSDLLRNLENLVGNPH